MCMPITTNPRRKFASDPAWRASKFIGHCLVREDRGTLKLTPMRRAVYNAALDTPGISDRLIAQGKKCWAK